MSLKSLTPCDKIGSDGLHHCPYYNKGEIINCDHYCSKEDEKSYGLTRFINVENGDFFIHLGEEYLRCMSIHKQYDIYINAIRIRDGVPCIFFDEDEVELLEK